MSCCVTVLNRVLWRMKMATIDTATYLRQRAQRGSRAKLLAVLAKAPDVEPEPDDRLPE